MIKPPVGSAEMPIANLSKNNMRDATLLFLVKRTNGKISEICLAMKKRGFGKGRWNGAGGKVEKNESIDEAAKREVLEEIGVEINKMDKIAELTFIFPEKPDWDQIVHTYFSDSWKNEPVESEEMSPRWFRVEEIPFSEMWPDDIFWLPQALRNNKIKAVFKFGDGDYILEQKIEIIEQL